MIFQIFEEKKIDFFFNLAKIDDFSFLAKMMIFSILAKNDDFSKFWPKFEKIVHFVQIEKIYSMEVGVVLVSCQCRDTGMTLVSFWCCQHCRNTGPSTRIIYCTIFPFLTHCLLHEFSFLKLPKQIFVVVAYKYKIGRALRNRNCPCFQIQNSLEYNNDPTK